MNGVVGCVDGVGDGSPERVPARPRGPQLVSPRLERFAEFDRVRHGFVQFVLVEFVFRTADNDAGDTIANEVGERTAFAPEPVNPNEDRERILWALRAQRKASPRG